jgi:hypothetical protein|tara:strand:+ start:2123 stop:3295 length:1173 start_codon:yes stop_codon:yes gene_type:complete
MDAYKTSAIQHGISSEGSHLASNYANRPEDERFDTLEELVAFANTDCQGMTSRVVDTHKLNIVGKFDQENISQGELRVEYDCPKTGAVISSEPTNWSAGQLATLAGAPAGYIKDLPAPLAADCLTWGLRHNRGREIIKTYDHRDGGNLRAATGPDYGRILNREMLAPVVKVANEGQWKVPGSMSVNGTYDPHASTGSTLFASDRDMFGFLCDDLNPIEIGKLPNGEPDLVFRGFYWWNSEVGSKTAGLACMYLRGVCQNRNLWGVENFEEIKIRHTKNAVYRFYDEMAPALETYSHHSTSTLLAGVEAARDAKIAKDDDDALEFLTKRGGLSARMAKAAMARHIQEEQKPIRNVWDAAQGITAIARDIPHQDARVNLERKAGALLDKIAA